MTPLSTAQGWVQKLTAAGIRAAVDPRNMNPPFVLFAPPSDVRLDLNCGGTAEMSALLIVPGPGAGDAWAQLESFATRIIRDDLLPVERVAAVTFTGAGDAPLPAYEFTWSEPVSWQQTP
jgi:hypothetical protein